MNTEIIQYIFFTTTILTLISMGLFRVRLGISLMISFFNAGVWSLIASVFV